MAVNFLYMNSINISHDGARRVLVAGLAGLFGQLLGATSLKLKQAMRKPIRVLFPIPFAGGLNRDITSRLFNEAGVEHYFENKFGASGVIATKFILEESNSDTIMIVSNTVAISNFIQHKDKIGMRFEDAFKCIGAMYSTAFVLVTRSNGPLDVSFSEFIQKLNTRNSQLSYSTTGNFDIPHLCGSMLGQALKVDLLAVPYKNSHLLPVLSGEVDFTFASTAAVAPLLASQQVRAIAHTSAKSLEVWPFLPSLTKLKGFQAIDSTFGLVASKFMKNDFVSEINSLLNHVLDDKNFALELRKSGADLYPSHRPEDYEKYLRSERKKYENIIASVV